MFHSYRMLKCLQSICRQMSTVYRLGTHSYIAIYVSHTAAIHLDIIMNVTQRRDETKRCTCLLFTWQTTGARTKCADLLDGDDDGSRSTFTRPTLAYWTLLDTSWRWRRWHAALCCSDCTMHGSTERVPCRSQRL